MSALSDQVVSRLLPKYVSALTFAQLATAVSGASAQDKAEIVELAKAGDVTALGRKIRLIVAAHLRALAEAEATTLLADGALSAEELERLFG